MVLQHFNSDTSGVAIAHRQSSVEQLIYVYSLFQATLSSQLEGQGLQALI
ncbi:MAG: hypothetical protein AB1589_36865 [Cyanobacteriota bacterium]